MIIFQVRSRCNCLNITEYCNKCGAELNTSDNFCSKCGAERKSDVDKKDSRNGSWEEIVAGIALIFIGPLLVTSFWQFTSLCNSIFGQIGQALIPNASANCIAYTVGTIGGFLMLVGGAVLIFTGSRKYYAKQD